MFGLFSSLTRKAARKVVPIKEHPDFMLIADVPNARMPARDGDSAFRRDYGDQRVSPEAAARLA